MLLTHTRSTLGPARSRLALCPAGPHRVHPRKPCRTAVLGWARSAGSSAKERLDKDGKLAVPSWLALPDGARPWFAAAEEIAGRLQWSPPPPAEYQIADPIVPLVTAESGETLKELLPSTVFVSHISTKVMYEVDRHKSPGARQLAPAGRRPSVAVPASRRWGQAGAGSRRPALPRSRQPVLGLVVPSPGVYVQQHASLGHQRSDG